MCTASIMRLVIIYCKHVFMTLAMFVYVLDDYTSRLGVDAGLYNVDLMFDKWLWMLPLEAATLV